MTKQAIRAKIIASRIVADIGTRRGIGNEWEELPKFVQEEIKDHWENLILSILEAK